MSRQRKIHIVLMALAMIALAGLGFLFFSLRSQAFKDSLETRISNVAGLRVLIEGDIDLQLVPPGLAFSGIVMRDGDSDVLTAKRVVAVIALRPLLAREVRVAKLAFDDAALSLRRDQVERWSVRSAGQATDHPPVSSLSLRNAAVRYVDESAGAEVELQGLDLELRGLQRNGAGFFSSSSCSGKLRTGHLRFGRIKVTNLSGTVTGGGSRYRLDPLRFALFGGEAQGMVQLDAGPDAPAWSAEAAAEELSLDELSLALAGKKIFEGDVEVRSTLAGKIREQTLETLAGTFKMSGTDLVQRGFDLDRTIENFRKSRNIGLLDIGAYVVAGPVGALVNKGVDVANLVWAASREDRQTIAKLVFNWSLEKGVARTEDVALRTDENRLALNGAVDLVRGRYDGMTLGLLDARGCAELTEKISGPLTDPTVEKVGMLSTLAGPLVGTLKKGWQIIDPGECQPFYQGVVDHPGEKGAE